MLCYRAAQGLKLRRMQVTLQSSPAIHLPTGLQVRSQGAENTSSRMRFPLGYQVKASHSIASFTSGQHEGREDCTMPFEAKLNEQ